LWRRRCSPTCPTSTDRRALTEFDVDALDPFFCHLGLDDFNNCDHAREGGYG
jgi:hypothetical protein